MGFWTFNNFREELQFEFGNNEDFLSVPLKYSGTSDIYKVWTNVAYRDLTTRHRFWDIKKRFYFPELETDTTKTTEDGTPYVTAPTDCLFVQGLYDETNNVHLKWMPWSEYEEKTDRSDTSKESNPKKWTVRGATGSGSNAVTKYIYLYPTPDTDDETIRIYYRKRISVLSSGSDATEIGEEWDEPILILASMKGYMRLRDWNNFEKLKEEWKDMVRDRMEIYTPEELARRDWFRIDPAYRRGNRR